MTARPPLDGLEPVSRVFGFDRGLCIDRYYIESFLEVHSGDVAGRVLEVADDNYTRRFGGDKVTRGDVLHVEAGAPSATLQADLGSPDCSLSVNAFDCIILTQTLTHIYNVREAVHQLHRILAPGGVLLATLPGLSQISRYDMERWGDYWRFTNLSARRLFSEVFSPERVAVQSHGNVLTAASLLYGLAAGELTREELDHEDPDYQVVITVRATKEST